MTSTELRAAAERATPGPWQRSGIRQTIHENCIMVGPDHLSIIAIPVGRDPEEHAGAFNDAGFVATCDPQTILALLDRIEMLESRAEWQPIETAPRDGTEVWVYVAAAHGLPSFECMCAYHEDAGWCADELREVTHWQPLPPPAPTLHTLVRAYIDARAALDATTEGDITALVVAEVRARDALAEAVG